MLILQGYEYNFLCYILSKINGLKLFIIYLIYLNRSCKRERKWINVLFGEWGMGNGEWGMGNDYEDIINQIKFEELKGNLNVIALVSRANEIFSSKRDGYPIISKEDLGSIDFNAIIINSHKYYQEILSEINSLGIGEKLIINGKIFALLLFDYNRYVQLIKNPVTILSDDCWGVMHIINCF